MKKLKYLIITILMIFYLFPNKVLASGNISVSTSNLTINKNTSATFTITANNAAGRIDISSSNPGIASVSTSSIFLDMQSNTITVHGHSVGTTTIKIYNADVTTYDDEDLTGKTNIITINVKEPLKNNKPQNNNNISNLSTNNKLKELLIEGHKLTKKDDNNYTLTVSNDISNIEVKATAEDEKSKITGIGNHELNIGENNIEIIVTSESGAQNKINIKVTRKDGYYLEDLENLLNSTKKENININIDLDAKITSEQLKKIKDSNKKIKFNYYDKNKKIIYSWIVDGTKITDTKEFLTSISNISEYSKEISKLSNYANGLHVKFKHKGDLPKGTKVQLYVGDKFEDGNKVKLYHYDINKNTLDFIKDNLTVKKGYIEFDISHCSEYFITMSNISTIKEESSSINIFMILSVIELLIIITFISIYLLKVIHSNKKEKNNINYSNTENNNNINQDVEIQPTPTNIDINLSNINNNQNDNFGN